MKTREFALPRERKQPKRKCLGVLQMLDRWQSVEEIAEYLGVSRDTVYAWVNALEMPGYKVGRFWKFKAAEVDDWVRAGGAALGAPAEESTEDASSPI